MKKSYKTARQNFLGKQNLSGNFSMLLGLILAVIPLLMALQFFSGIGVTTLSCEQTKPTQIQCEVNQSKYLGLQQQPSTYLTKIKSAKFDYKNTREPNGEFTVDYFVSLVNTTDQESIMFHLNLFIRFLFFVPSAVFQNTEKPYYEPILILID